MKRLLLLSALIFMFIATHAQNQSVVKEKLTLEEKMEVVHSNAELNAQLSEIFGQDYSLSDKKVMDQLKINSADPKLSGEMRKTSLYLYYGEDYTQHLDLIETKK